MKALKTIVATAVIVFTLTTVAMAGVQHLSRGGDGATSAGQAQQAAAQPAAQSGVTLSTRQFVTLLHAVSGGSQDRGTTRTHDAMHERTHARQLSHSADSGASESGSSGGATHHTAIHHTGAHHTATHTASRDCGTHDGGGDGGCD
jgi:hypothetical protein